VAPAYAFVDELAGLGPRIQGAGSRERFNYWVRNFDVMRQTALFQCLWAEYNKARDEVAALPGAAARRTAAQAKLVPKRVEMIKPLRAIWTNLLATVSNPGEMGTIANWEQHLLPAAFEDPGRELIGLLGGPLPAYADLPSGYEGPARVFLPTVRTSAEEGEGLALKAIVLASGEASGVVLRWRPLGEGAFAEIAMEHAARGVYKAALPPLSRDIEYYVEARVEDKALVFPAAAPAICQTVVAIPRDAP
jgi:hypothetical protein